MLKKLNSQLALHLHQKDSDKIILNTTQEKALVAENARLSEKVNSLSISFGAYRFIEIFKLLEKVQMTTET